MTTKTTLLKKSYATTGLSFIGISFQRAIAVPAIRISLEGAVKAARRRAAQAAKPVAAQLYLI